MMKNSTGMTLVELLMVTVIVAILASVALPAYFGFIRESRRSDAAIALVELAAAAERFYADNRSFSGATPGILLGRNLSDDGHYLLSLAISGEGQGWQAGATPVDGGSQQEDACYRFLLNSSGIRGNEAANGQPVTHSMCWPE